MCSNYLAIDIPISNVPVVTSQTTGIMLRAVIKSLAYYKNQIPFPYDTFKLMTAKIQKQVSHDDNDDLHQMQIKRQQMLAMDTFKNIKTLLEVNYNMFITIDSLDYFVSFL